VVQVNRKRLTLCSIGCAKTFRKQPEKYLEKVADCPVLHNPVAKIEPAGRLVLNNGLFYFCCAGCKDGFLQSAQHLKKLEDVVTREVFTASDLSPRAEFKGQHYLFATEANKATFEKSPDQYAVLFAQ
jgi:YHS domain-containing protein